MNERDRPTLTPNARVRIDTPNRRYDGCTGTVLRQLASGRWLVMLDDPLVAKTAGLAYDADELECVGELVGEWSGV